ncbi:PCRF domain-containing protein, partial [Sphingomonas sp. 66-10]
MTAISLERIRQIEARRDELAALMATGDLSGERFVQVSKEYAELEPVAEAAADVRRLRQEAESLASMTEDADAELRAMAEEELRANKAALEAADRKL